jgi:hypothetical protein
MVVSGTRIRWEADDVALEVQILEKRAFPGGMAKGDQIGESRNENRSFFDPQGAPWAQRSSSSVSDAAWL